MGTPPQSHLFNLVILPAGSAGKPVPRFQCSATRGDRSLRLVSPEWTEPELRAALAASDTGPGEIEELLRGNRMAVGKRNPRKLFFSEQQLLAMGFTVPVPALKTGSTPTAALDTLQGTP